MKSLWISILSVAALLAAPPSSAPASAEVIEASAHGFVIGGEVRIEAPRARVWAVLSAPSLWWPDAHTWFGDASGLSLDLVPGGCWCETGENGAFARHMEVVYLSPETSLRLSGALGPLQGQGVAGALSLDLIAQDEATLLRWRYRVGGHAEGGLEAWSVPVNQVLSGNIERIRAVSEAN